MKHRDLIIIKVMSVFFSNSTRIHFLISIVLAAPLNQAFSTSHLDNCKGLLTLFLPLLLTLWIWLLHDQRVIIYIYINKICVSVCIGEGNGNPLKYSCLGDPMDRGAWRAAVHGVTMNWTVLSDRTTITYICIYIHIIHIISLLPAHLWIMRNHQKL